MNNIILIDNFISNDEILKCKDEINNIKNILREDRFDDEKNINVVARYNRIYLDEHYKGFRDNSYILKLIHEKLFADKIYDKANRINDLSFILLKKSTNHETQITSYNNNDEYNWHVDSGDERIWSGRILNYILFLNDKNFSGGNLEIINSYPLGNIKSISEQYKNSHPDYIIKPKNGTLVIMPSYLIHRVTKIKIDDINSDSMNRRLTINGHIGFKMS